MSMHIKAGTRIEFELSDGTTVTWRSDEDTTTEHLLEVIANFERIWGPGAQSTAEIPCPTCSGPIRETVGMVCQACGTDYAADVEVGSHHG